MLTKAAREARERRLKELDALGLYLDDRVEIYDIKCGHLGFHLIDDFSLKAKKLSNCINFYCRNKHKKKLRLPSYTKLVGLCQSTIPLPECKDWNYHYKNLPVQTAQQVILKVLDNWKSYFQAIKAYKIDPSKFLGPPKVPGYKRRRCEVVIPQNFNIKNNILKFKKDIPPIKLWGKYPSQDAKQVRIIPQATTYKVEVVYEVVLRKEALHYVEDYQRRIIGLDLGVNNFLACANNVGLPPFLISGRVMKALNQLYNKKKAIRQEILPYYYITDKNQKRQKKQRKWSKVLSIITQNRSKTIQDLLHKISRFIVDYCQYHKIDTVVAGYNSGWKQKISLGRKNNQNFVYLPHRQFLDVLKYKLADASVSYVEVDEAHTSKCSFLDDEPIGHHKVYKGKRVKRGLFRSAQGLVINADVNGALNILRKVFPKAFDAFKSQGSRGCGLHPIKLSNLFELSFKSKKMKDVSVVEVFKKLNTFIQVNQNV